MTKNNLDTQYLALLEDVLKNGVRKNDRTGVGTYSVFGRQMRFDLKEGFPLLTTKRIYTKSVFHELLWFLQGGDNIKYLVDNDVNIWNDWPYQKYVKLCNEARVDAFDMHGAVNDDIHPLSPLSQADFVKRVKEDNDFAVRWGDVGPVYGKQWIAWLDGYNRLNQIDVLIDLLRKDPDSRRMLITAWNPAELKEMLLPSCHYVFQVWTRELTAKERDEMYGKSGQPIKLVAHIFYDSQDVQEDKIVNKHIHEFLDKENVPSRALSLMFNMRSVDLGLGWSFDIASYATLLHMIAQCVNMQADELIITTGDTHIYTNHVEPLKEQLKRIPYDLPTLWLNPKITNIYDFKYDDIKVLNYQYHPAIKMDIAV